MINRLARATVDAMNVATVIPTTGWKHCPTLLALLLMNTALAAPQSPVAESSQLEAQGRFAEAAKLLKAAAGDQSLTAGERQHLAFELDRLDRIRKDFPLTQETLFQELKLSVRGVTAAEFAQWLKEGRFDSRQIDGQRCFMASSVGNLFWRHPELNNRRVEPKADSAYQKALWATCVAIQQAARKARTPYVLPKRFEVTMTVTANPDAAPDGQVIRAWLPVPRRYPFQDDFELLSTSSPVKQLAPEDSPIRSVFLEQPARKGQATAFTVEYRYRTDGVWFDVQPEKVQPADPTDPALGPFLREGPHIVFTPEMRALSQQIAGNENNPARRAKDFYHWISDHIQYSYAIEYSTIRNLGEYCRAHGYGDCGQEALLFLTLCRLNGIPARWQSGWNTFPGGQNIHDWTEIYLAPYGWIPVDPWAGIYATRYATALTPAQRREVRDFYFGGLDQYRMAANCDHCQTLAPPKQSLRSDNVDFQRGELEWGAHNLYFDQYSYRLELKELEAPSRR